MATIVITMFDPLIHSIHKVGNTYQLMNGSKIIGEISHEDAVDLAMMGVEILSELDLSEFRAIRIRE